MCSSGDPAVREQILYLMSCQHIYQGNIDYPLCNCFSFFWLKQDREAEIANEVTVRRRCLLNVSGKATLELWRVHKAPVERRTICHMYYLS
jgi:hypothetical protein